MKPCVSGRVRLRTAAWLAALAAILAFANSLGNDFAYDDRLIVAGNEAIQRLETLPGTFLEPYWPDRHGRELGLWRPVTTWVYGLQWALWDGHPAGFHLVNVILNGVAAALVVLLLGRLLPVSAALSGGLLFAVHPVHAEAVANVVGMAELLSSVLYLGACLVVARWPGRMAAGRVAIVGGLFLAAVLVKESAFTLPGAVLLIDAARRDLRVGQLREYLAQRWPVYTVLAVTIVLVLAARLAVLGAVADPNPPMGAEILAKGEVPRIWTVLGTWPEVFRLLFLPVDLSADYSPLVIPIGYGWTARNLLGLLIGLAVLGVAWWSVRRGPLTPGAPVPAALGFGVLWYVITVLPTSNLFFLTGVLLAERTQFLPSVGLAAAVGWILARLQRERPRTGALVIVVALSLLLCRTVARNPTWRDNTTVFGTLLRQHPESGRAQWVAGDIRIARGDHAGGLAAYRRAIGTLGGSYALLAGIGRRLVAEGLDRPARHVLYQAWRDRPELGLAPSLLAVLHDRQGRWRRSEVAARGALAADPESAVQMHLLARSLACQGRIEEAIEARRRVIRLGEDRAGQWKWLAQLELRRGDTAQALASLESGGRRARTATEIAEIDSLRAVLADSWPEPSRCLGTGADPGCAWRVEESEKNNAKPGRKYENDSEKWLYADRATGCSRHHRHSRGHRSAAVLECSGKGVFRGDEGGYP